MKRCTVGLALGFGLALLLGAGGDDPLAKRVKSLESQFSVYQNQIARANSRLDVVEGRLKALEEKIKSGAGGATADIPAPPDAAAGPGDDAPGMDDDAPVSDEARERAYKLKVRGLTIKGYREVGGPAGVKDVWVSPIVTRPGAKNDVESAGQMRYLGRDDLKEYNLTFRVVYRDARDNPVGYAEFVVAGKVLKDDKDFVFRTPVTLSGRASLKNGPTIRLMKKEKEDDKADGSSGGGGTSGGKSSITGGKIHHY